jgi:hypothetical protein
MSECVTVYVLRLCACKMCLNMYEYVTQGIDIVCMYAKICRDMYMSEESVNARQALRRNLQNSSGVLPVFTVLLSFFEVPTW